MKEITIVAAFNPFQIFNLPHLLSIIISVYPTMPRILIAKLSNARVYIVHPTHLTA
jgi:hypothetical protein